MLPGVLSVSMTIMYRVPVYELEMELNISEYCVSVVTIAQTLMVILK